MKTVQVRNCFDDVLRMLAEKERADQAVQVERDKTAEGLRYWKKRAEEAEAKLLVLGEDSSTKAELITERDVLKAKLSLLAQEHTGLVQALDEVIRRVNGTRV